MRGDDQAALATQDRLISEIKEIRSWREADISSIRVTTASSVYDTEWDFFYDREEWPASIGRAKLRVRWDSYQNIPEPMRKELQRIFALRHLSPSSFSGRKLIGNSMASLVVCTLRFFDFLLSSEAVSEGSVTSIGDISWRLLSDAAKSFSGNPKEIVKGLRCIYSSASKTLCSKDTDLAQGDIKNLEFRHVIKSRTSDDSDKCIPDNLFALLTSQSAAMIAGFLEGVGKERIDSSVNPSDATLQIESDYLTHWDQYIYYRQRRADWRDRAANKMDVPAFSIDGFRIDRLGRTPTKPLLDYVKHLNIAAITIIMAFTGMRYSEVASLKMGTSLESVDGLRLIKGKRFKGQKGKRVKHEYWVAIPIVEDAIATLEELSRLKNNEYLASSTDTNGKSQKNPKAFTAQAICEAIGRLTSSLDESGEYASYSYNTHQFKHTLTRHLVRSGLGLAYISFQLKHAHQAFQSTPSDVTLGYGGVAGELQGKYAADIDRHKKEVGMSLYDPDAPVMGIGGAHYAERRKAYFEGMMAEGYTKEEIQDYLIEVQSPFVNVGLGYCGGRRPDELGNKPPCVGSLRCNPVECSNAVVTPDNLPHWKKVGQDNRRMAQDERFFYAKDQFIAAADQAEKVVKWVEAGGVS